MTAPLHSEQVKNGRKLIGDMVSPPANVKARDNSIDYNTIQQPSSIKNNGMPQYP